MAVHTQQPPRKPKVYRPISETRKVRKPLMERKRRERINSSLEQLALLLKEAKLVAADKPVAKLEKADILELTVRHLKSVRQINFPCEGDGENIIKKEAENSSNDRNFSMQENKNHVVDENSCNQNGSHVHLKTPNDEICGGQELHDAPGEKTRDSNYLEGFHKCLSEVRQATECAQEFCGLKERLFDHLDSCLHNLTSDTASKEKIGTGKRALSQGNDCEIKARKKRKRCDKESHLPPDTSTNEVPSELTLVPMQLTDGRVAFLVHGDAKILISNKSNDIGKTIPPSGGTTLPPSNELPKKFPKLLPAPELHKIPNCGKSIPSLDCKPQVAMTGSVAAAALKSTTHQKIHYAMPERTAVSTPPSKITNLLKLYPNIKTVSLPVGTCVPTLHSNTFVTIPQSSVASSVSASQDPDSKFQRSMGVVASIENSPAHNVKPQETLSSSNGLLTESYVSQTQLLTSNANHAQCATSQTSVQKCVVYPGAHLMPSKASISSTVTQESVPSPCSASAGQHLVNGAVPTSQVANPSWQTNSAMLVIDSSVSANPSQSIVNVDQIARPSAVSFPPTPPPSVDHYASELQGDGNQLNASSLSPGLSTSAHRHTAQSCDLTSQPSIVSGMYSYLQYCNPTPQTIVCPTASMNSARDDEEFIDVENVTKEDLPQSSGSSANVENLKYNDDDKGEMWRPW